MRPFILPSADQFLPDPPPSLQSAEWPEAFNQIKTYGEATSITRTPEQTSIGRFWSANVVRQYNRLAREVAFASTTRTIWAHDRCSLLNTLGPHRSAIVAT